eukprot:TRINITY_DN772_c0_g1_i3.p1 TRINITY_DN772_c0_g1~~TRINITY_DN772_c0_g1_i3.p1  ORF type:complete len:176 (+),score=7.23 TRINITY_DN772_c0_g1_i3:330-857(+)
MKGPCDEVNNELFTNFSLHPQQFPCPVTRKVTRCLPTRVAVCLRSILIRVRKIEDIRPLIVSALQSFDLNLRRKVIQNLSFSSLVSHLDVDDWKFIAFHLGQTVALIQGRELFSKKSLSEYLPSLKPFLYREYQQFTRDNVRPLESIKEEFVRLVEHAKFVKKGDYSLFYVGVTK